MLITSKDGQTATGDWANFDVKANTVLLGDDVVVSRGKDVAEGPRLKIDLTTGMYRFELEQEPAAAASRSRQPALRRRSRPRRPAASSHPRGRACPPGKQCLLFYPQGGQGQGQGRCQEGPARVRCRQDGRCAGSRAPAPARSSAGRIEVDAAVSLQLRSKRTQPRSGRSAPADRNGHAAAHADRWTSGRTAGEGWLTVVNVQKSYRSRMVVQGRQPGDGPRRGRRAAGPQRRRQDDRVLHDHRPGAGRCRQHHPRRPRRDAPADVPARPPRHRLPAAGGLDLPRPDGRAEHHGRAGAGRAQAQDGARSSSTACSRSSASPGCASRRRWRSRAASGAAARSPARWPPALVHAARRALCRHRSDGRRRHSAAGAPSHRSAASAC